MQAHKVADLFEPYDSVKDSDIEFGHLKNGNEYVDINIEGIPSEVFDEVKMNIPNDWGYKMKDNTTLRFEHQSKPNL